MIHGNREPFRRGRVRPRTGHWRRPSLSLIGALFGLMLWTGELAGQGTGAIAGRVYDEGTSEPLAVAQIHIPSLGVGTLTNLDGRFMLRNLPPGTYDLVVELLGYTTKTITGIEIQAGRTVTLNVTLPPEAIEVEGVTVSVERERGNAAAVLNERKNATAVLDAVGSQDISRSPDSDAADVAKRITGVTVADGRYVYVRGLNERYSQTSLNGSPLPSPEPEKEVVPLDLFPSEFLETLTTQKTYTPDQPADFSGGTVQIRTKEFFDEPFMRVGVSLGANSEAHFNGSNFLRYDGGGTDFLGVDDGARALPGAVPGGLNGSQLPSDPGQREIIGESFQREFTPFRENAPINFGLDLATGTRADIFGRELGLLFGFNYAQDWAVRDNEIERKWRTDAFDPSIPSSLRSANVDYTFDRGIRKVNMGAILNLKYMLSPSHKIGVETMFNRIADDETRSLFGANREDLGGFIADDRLRFVSRELLWGQLTGEHKLFWDSRFEWRTALAEASRDEPGLREAIYQRALSAPDSAPLLLVRRGESGRYFFSELVDDDLNLEASWKVPFGIWSDRAAAIKVGGQYRARDRDFAARRFGWVFVPGVIEKGTLDESLTDEAIQGSLNGAGTFVIDEVQEPGDRYTIDEERHAGYGMLEVPLTGWLRTIAGARYETYDLMLEIPTRAQPLTDLSQSDVLPSVNLIWTLSDAINVRGAFSRTLDRPEFRELAPFQFTEATSLRQLVGNPDLEVARVTNYDLRWDWFMRPGELLSISAFYKKFDDPIEQVFLAAASAAYSYQNGEEAELYGVELDVRQRLDRIAEALYALTFQGNLALTESEVTVKRQGAFVPTNTRRPLEGQSPWVVNAGLIYTHPRGATELGLFYNIFGERVAAAGGSGVPDIYEQPRNQLDLTLRQKVVGGVSTKFKITNLLNDAYEFEQSANGITLLQRKYQTGTSYSLGFSYEF
jgi:outer membrane receptor protein involved in Fe transport